MDLQSNKHVARKRIAKCRSRRRASTKLRLILIPEGVVEEEVEEDK